jgi:hypothetical protein
MTTVAYHQPQANSLRHYLKVAGNAAHAFAEALFAAQGRQFVAQEVRTAHAISQRVKAEGRRQLFSLASQYDSMSPGLAAELRSVAARD